MMRRDAVISAIALALIAIAILWFVGSYDGPHRGVR